MRLTLIASVIFLILGCNPTPDKQPGWPESTNETKPWTRWWWHGSALTKEGITAELEAYKKAGLGGVEITPIYGVMGYEDKFVDYLTPQWMELLMHTLKEGERLGLGIDMATGTGWPFGGPWVKEQDACKTMRYKVYEVNGGSRLTEKIEFVQEPYLRAVGNQIYEVHDSFSTDKTQAKGTRKEPLPRLDPKSINIKDLKQPISANQNLQALALDQVIFERPLALKTLRAYGDNGKILDLTDSVSDDGTLNWSAPSGHWRLYAVFEGSHGKMVERAGPGGEGNVIDHFSLEALRNYLLKFDSAFAQHDIRSLRAFFNDSYEVDDARGAADWTPYLFQMFKEKRGYDLRDHLPALFGQDDPEKNNRVLCDYRETISDLLLQRFTGPWTEWAHQKSAITRNQAHGSPANILDLYAKVDIPEIEGVDPLRMKLASSAGNVTGKKLISSESATWLGEHFESTLSEIKVAVDRFLLNGVNHIFYHGTAYSPQEEPWPGWLFYAAVHLNPRNPQWNDFDALNKYVERCQSFLQSKSDNDVLLYYPVYDRFSTPGEEMVEHFDAVDKQFSNTPFLRGARNMLEKGYAFDYISDKQISHIKIERGLMVTEGGARYKTLVLPRCKYIPAQTFQKIIALAEEGGTVILLEGPPESFSGFGAVERNKEIFESTRNKIKTENHASGIQAIEVGEGGVLLGDSIATVLEKAQVRRETMVDLGLNFVRKKSDDRTIYFIANQSAQPFEGWVSLNADVTSAILYDAMSGTSGKAKTQEAGGTLQIYLQLSPGESIIVEGDDEKVTAGDFQYHDPNGAPVPVQGKWSLTFDAGGPVIPAKVALDTLKSWTTMGAAYADFSGTATYAIQVNHPGEKSTWFLDLGIVHESADVFLNGKLVGTLIGQPARLAISPELLRASNLLEIKVSNLMANRIAYLDRNQVQWKKFYNVNFPARKIENRKNGLFDATHWVPKESGLIGPVRFVEAKRVD